jgi:peptide-methionine (S)-S-oxide reductase
MINPKLLTVGAGCFWCVEAVLQRIRGVESATSGYMGGAKETANY